MSAPDTSGSWFGALPDADQADIPGRASDTGRDAAAPQDTGSPPDSQFMSRQAGRLVGAQVSTVQRLYRTFLGARAALGVALLLAQGAAVVFGTGTEADIAGALLVIAYAALALAMWLAPDWPLWGAAPKQPRLLRRQMLVTMGVDFLVFGSLHLLAARSSFNYAALLLLPVLMAGALTSRLTTLAMAALASLIVLGVAAAWVASGAEVASAITQAGVAGLGFFVIGLMMNELSMRLAREERTARGSLELARQQAQLNRLVIEEMQEGVLVVDRKGRVRASNPAAGQLLAVTDAVGRPGVFVQLRGVPAWAPLVQAMERAFASGGAWPEAGRTVDLHDEQGGRRQLHVRMRFTKRRAAEASEDFCVLLIEDERAVQARARQDKLAAMGRVSAGIAHEIRNPLAAIAQANALLAEDVVTDAQRRLAQMVSDNVERLKRIVDDVMEVAPGLPASSVPIDLVETVHAICLDWAQVNGVVVDGVGELKLELPDRPSAIRVSFDPDHLRRVLVNLLDNAKRHGTRSRAATWVRLAQAGRQVELSVLSDGAAIDAETERFLFEPFFSTRSRGTGLGLYICRELCERYDGSIDYLPWPASTRYRNEFRVTMPLLGGPEAAQATH